MEDKIDGYLGQNIVLKQHNQLVDLLVGHGYLALEQLVFLWHVADYNRLDLVNEISANALGYRTLSSDHVLHLNLKLLRVIPELEAQSTPEANQMLECDLLQLLV